MHPNKSCIENHGGSRTLLIVCSIHVYLATPGERTASTENQARSAQRPVFLGSQLAAWQASALKVFLRHGGCDTMWYRWCLSCLWEKRLCQSLLNSMHDGCLRRTSGCHKLVLSLYDGSSTLPLILLFLHSLLFCVFLCVVYASYHLLGILLASPVYRDLRRRVWVFCCDR